MTNRKWSYNNKPYPEKCQIVFHSSRNICLGSQGRTLFGGIVKKTTSSLGKKWRARCPDSGWSAVLFLLKSDLKYMKFRFLGLKISNDKWLLQAREKHMHCLVPMKSARARTQSPLHQHFCSSLGWVTMCVVHCGPVSATVSTEWEVWGREQSLLHAKVNSTPAGNYPYLHWERKYLLGKRSHETEEEGDSSLYFPVLPWDKGLLASALDVAGLVACGLFGLILVQHTLFWRIIVVC